MAGVSDIFLRIPLLAIAFAFVLIVYWANAFFIIYHLVRFGIGPRPKLFALIFFVGSMVFLGFSILAYGNIDFSLVFQDWPGGVDVKNIFPTPF